MVRWAEKLPAETLVLCEGIVQKPADRSGKGVESAFVHDAEVRILKVGLRSFPFTPSFRLRASAELTDS